MAQTTKAVTVKTPLRLSLGARFLNVVEVELGTEYKAKGVTIPVSELGLPDEIVEAAFITQQPVLAAEGAEAFVASLLVSKPGESGSTLKVQIFGSGAAKKEALFELADKEGTAKEAKLVIVVIGR